MIPSISRIPLALSVTAALAASASLIVVLDRPKRELPPPAVAEPGQLLGAIPRSREHTAVLSWIFEHRPDAPTLEFLRWSPARPVDDNPFTKEPAILVALVVKSRSDAGERLEHLSFFLRHLEVLGSINGEEDSLRVVKPTVSLL